MIAIFVTTDAPARDAKLLGERHTFMTPRAALSSDGNSWRVGSVIDGYQYFVYAVTLGAGR